MKLACTLALIASLAAGTAHAEPDSPKNENTALALSLGGTLASAGLMAYGVMRDGDEASGVLIGAGLVSSLVTPSLGQFYSGRILTPGLGLRVAGGAVALIGVAQTLSCVSADRDCDSFTDGPATIALGGGLAALGAVLDIATAPRAARSYNERHLQLVPASTGANLGLSLTGRF